MILGQSHILNFNKNFLNQILNFHQGHIDFGYIISIQQIPFQFHIEHFHSEVARKIFPSLMLIQTISMASLITEILLFDLNHQTLINTV